MNEPFDTRAPRTQRKRPLRIAVLCSYRAPGLVRLLNQDRRRGVAYDIVCCLTSNETFLEEVAVERRGIPCLSHPIRRFCHERGVSIRDRGARLAYDARTVERLAAYSPDVVLLDGYLLLLTRPMLDAFAGRIVNIHHSDLMLRDDDGRVRYPGLHAVRDALVAGEASTCASAHVVTERVDEGPTILRSWRFAAPEGVGVAGEQGNGRQRAAIRAHEAWMLREAWAPMMAAILGLIADAVDDRRAPLDVTRIGRWTVRPDGSLTPDVIAAKRAMVGV